jgi:hypothetical protein
VTQSDSTARGLPAAKTLSVKLSLDVENALAAAARRRGVSRSFLVREALIAYLDRDHERNPKRFGELAADLIGCCPGPEDLSTNPEHMEGFGS